MKTSNYKTSGILEAYALGLVSNAEKQGIERMMEAHPELGLYVEEFESEMESQFIGGLVPPPPNLRELVELRLDQQSVKPYQERKRRPSPDPAPDRMNYVDVEVNNTHIQVHKLWRAAFIAVFILSKVFLVFGLYYYFKADTQQGEINRLNKQIQQQTITVTPK